MTTLLRASDIIGLPVVSITAGEDVAEVRDVVIAPDDHRIVGFTLNKRGRLAPRDPRRLPGERVVAVGPDAVMVAHEDDLVEEGDADEELVTTDPKRQVLGNRVVSEDGVDLGELTGVIVLAGTALSVAGYEVTGERLSNRPGGRAYVPAAAQIAISGEALVVPAEAVPFVRDDLAGFASAVEEFRTQLGAERWSKG